MRYPSASPVYPYRFSLGIIFAQSLAFQHVTTEHLVYIHRQCRTGCESVWRFASRGITGPRYSQSPGMSAATTSPSDFGGLLKGFARNTSSIGDITAYMMPMDHLYLCKSFFASRMALPLQRNTKTDILLSSFTRELKRTSRRTTSKDHARHVPARTAAPGAPARVPYRTH